MTNYFEGLAQEITRVSDEWPKSHPGIAKQPSQSEQYAGVADIVFNTVNLRAPQLPERLTGNTTRRSARRMLRYCEIAALSFRNSGEGGVDRLRDLMLTDLSFQPLGWIASSSNKLAANVEQDLELRTFAVPPSSYIIDKFQFTDAGLDLDELVEDSITLHQGEIKRNGDGVTEGMCPAHRSMVLQPIYKSFVQICAKDENLFPLTLAK